MRVRPHARAHGIRSSGRGALAKQRARFATNTHTPPAAHAADEDVNNATRRHADTQTATMHSKLLLASTFGAAAAFQAPAASKATTSLQAMYNPSSFDDVQSLPGILNPTGFFDPAGLSNDVSASELKRYREAELTHGRVAMLASLGFLVGESGFTPLFEGKIDGIGINQFWQVPTGFWPVILLFIAVPETFRALRGWMEPTVPENYFQLRPGYTPGDLVPRSAETYLLCGVCLCVVVTSSTSTCDMCRVDGLGRALLVCVVTSFVCRACLSRLGERELVPRLTRAVSRAGLRSPRPQARGPRGAQGDADQGAPARPPRHARGRRHDRPGAPDGRHALLSACGDGPAAPAMGAPRHQVFLPQ